MPLLAMPTGFVGALCLTMVPDLARRTAGGDRRAAGQFLDRILSATSVLMAPAMALLAVVGPAVGQLVYRESTVGGHMTWLAVGTLLSCYQSVLSGALNGLSLQNLGARNAIVSDIVQLGFTFFAIPRWGLAGFTAGFVLSSLVGMGMNLASVLRATGRKPEFYRWFARPLLGAALTWGWSRLLFRILEGSNCPLWANCLLCVGLGLAIYIAALQAQGVALSGVMPHMRTLRRRET
jgi:O-antigen/teichoic acid export membrane protein